MIPFLIYLFESGMCLTLLFLVYYLFLRKETYFTFNRIYLISILVLSLLLPILHLNLTLPESKSLEQSISERNRIKNYYENLIALTDPDYQQAFTKPFRENKTDNFEELGESGFQNNPAGTIQNKTNFTTQKNITGFWADIHWARFLLILYLFGMLIFTGRLILLLGWITQTKKNYGSTSESGVNLVKMDEEVPPFSFFRFVFMNRETASHSGFSQILTHEKVHIMQGHSYDLMLAHAITIFQWFNPFAWLINKAMKTNHEYIADRNVVEQGYELFDYQSLLLKQIISIRSVELVNNFNLINIKKRIAMMTKIKSGLAAQLKALVVIPAAIFLFFFFAEVSFAQDHNESININFQNKLHGFWLNIEDESYGELLHFKDHKLQILEKNNTYKVFTVFFNDPDNKTVEQHYKKHNISKIYSNPDEISQMHIISDDKTLPFYFNLKGKELFVQWSWGRKASVYKKVDIKNSLDYKNKSPLKNLELVAMKYYRTALNPENTYIVFVNESGEIFIDGVQVSLKKFPYELVDSYSKKENPFASWEITPVLAIDARCTMEKICQIFETMRKIDQLRHILSIKPVDEKVPEVFYHNVGIPRLLPPKDAELMNEEEVEKSGMKIIRIDLTKGVTPEKAETIFKKEIQKDKKYVVSFSYKNETTYKEYLSILDKFYLDIFAKRNALAQEKYKLPYDDLATAQQKEIRKNFPMVITERNIDQKE